MNLWEPRITYWYGRASPKTLFYFFERGLKTLSTSTLCASNGGSPSPARIDFVYASRENSILNKQRPVLTFISTDLTYRFPDNDDRCVLAFPHLTYPPGFISTSLPLKRLLHSSNGLGHDFLHILGNRKVDPSGPRSKQCLLSGAS